MNIEIVITGKKGLHKSDSFGKSIVYLIKEDNSIKKLVQENKPDIDRLLQYEYANGIEAIIPKHITLEENFALRLNILESIDCNCLKPISSLGSFLKEIMIDNYQLILTRKHWRDANKIDFFFEAVDYGNVDEFITHFLRGKKIK